MQPPPVAEAKKRCEEQAEKKHEEKLSCFCTDDPKFVGDFCKQHEKPEQPDAPEQE